MTSDVRFDRNKDLDLMYKYRDMQRSVYDSVTTTFEQAKEECVGNWKLYDEHSYICFLLKEFGSVPYGNALDFGCGIGRVMNFLLNLFHRVDGADFHPKNLCYVYEYLKRHPLNRFSLFLTDGISCTIKPYTNTLYNLIYSTLVFQHICCHSIRTRILEDMIELLKDNGQCVIQMGYGWDNGIHWFDNKYDAIDTNCKFDVSIPDEKHLEIAVKDFESIGFTNIKHYLLRNGGIDGGYHKDFVYFYMNKPKKTINITPTTNITP